MCGATLLKNQRWQGGRESLEVCSDECAKVNRREVERARRGTFIDPAAPVMSLTEVAREMNLSRATIRKIEGEALAKIAPVLKSHGL